jgi:hypothetical protein
LLSFLTPFIKIALFLFNDPNTIRKMNSDEDDDIARPERLPIYRKGKEIFDMVNKITELIPENNEYLNEVKSRMLSDAALLTVKVAGAEAAELYDLKMENAAIIRKAAHDLMVQQHSLDMFGFEEDSEE